MKRILVVEDEPAIALGLGDDLRMEGYEVELLADGAEATRRAREASFDDQRFAQCLFLPPRFVAEGAHR